jgi:hypothetical protein
MADDYADAAVRHYRDAENLAERSRFDNAGYLIGYAAECAMKQKLRDLHGDQKKNFDGHHPQPQRQIRTFLEGRGLSGPWLSLVKNRSLFLGWSPDIRYASNDQIDSKKYAVWKVDAERVMSAAKLRWSQPPVKPGTPDSGETNAP